MYSIVLVMAMSSSGDVPQGILFNRGGCSGQKTVVVAPVRTAIRNLAANTVDRLRTPLLPRSSVVGLVVRNTYSHEGSGGVPAGYKPMPKGTGPTVVTPPMMESVGGPLRDRAALHRQLRVALRDAKVPVVKRVMVQRVLNDRDMYEDLVSEVRGMMAKAATAKGQSIKAWGDGKWLQVLIDNLPAIIDAVERIIKLFG